MDVCNLGYNSTIHTSTRGRHIHSIANYKNVSNYVPINKYIAKVTPVRATWQYSSTISQLPEDTHLLLPARHYRASSPVLHKPIKVDKIERHE